MWATSVHVEKKVLSSFVLFTYHWTQLFRGINNKGERQNSPYSSFLLVDYYQGRSCFHRMRMELKKPTHTGSEAELGSSDLHPMHSQACRETQHQPKAQRQKRGLMLLLNFLCPCILVYTTVPSTGALWHCCSFPGVVGKASLTVWGSESALWPLYCASPFSAPAPLPAAELRSGDKRSRSDLSHHLWKNRRDNPASICIIFTHFAKMTTSLSLAQYLSCWNIFYIISCSSQDNICCVGQERIQTCWFLPCTGHALVLPPCKGLRMLK